MSIKEWGNKFKFERDEWFNYKEVYDEAVNNLKGKQGLKVLVEIGLWKGMSFSYLCLKAKKELTNFMVFGIDTFLGDPENYREQELISKMERPLKDVFISNLESLDLHNGTDYYLLDMDSTMASKYIQVADFVFIDGGHSKEQVIKDIETWLPKTKKDGTLAGHDYDGHGVKQAVKEKFGNNFTVVNTSWVYKNA
jgi:hypothetical protein